MKETFGFVSLESFCNLPETIKDRLIECRALKHYEALGTGYLIRAKGRIMHDDITLLSPDKYDVTTRMGLEIW